MKIINLITTSHREWPTNLNAIRYKLILNDLLTIFHWTSILSAIRIYYATAVY